MAVTATTTSVSYAGNGSTTVFSVPFKFMAGSDLLVTGTTSGTVVTYSLGTAYSVAGDGVDTGGAVTFVAAPASGTTVTISRKTAPTQPSSLQVQGAFSAKTHEAALDRVTLVEQETQARTASLESRIAAVEASPALTAIQSLVNTFQAISVKDVLFGAKGDNSHDDGPAFNAAIAYAQANNVRTIYVPEGLYNIVTSINVTGIIYGLTIRGCGRLSQLQATCTGKAVLDLVGSNGLTLEKLWIQGSDTFTPAAGILCGRTTGDGSAGNHTFRDLIVEGSWGIGAYVGTSSELNVHLNCVYVNRKAGGNVVAVVANNLWASANYQYSGQPALSSDYKAISPTPSGGNTVHYFIGGYVATATGNTDTTSTILLLENIRGLQFSSFLQGFGKYGVRFKGGAVSCNLTGPSEDELFATYGYYIDPGVTVDRLVMTGFVNQGSPFYGDTGSVVKNSIIHAQFGLVASGPDVGQTFVVDTLKDSDVNLMGVGGKIRSSSHGNKLWGDSAFWTLPSDTLGADYQTQALDLAGTGHVIFARHINDNTNYDERLYTKVLNAPAIQQRPQYFTAQSGTLTPNLWTGTYLDISLVGNLTVASPSAGPAGNGGLGQDGSRLSFVFRQDATGGRTITWGGAYRGTGAWQPYTEANSVSAIDFVLGVDGNWWAVGSNTSMDLKLGSQLNTLGLGRVVNPPIYTAASVVLGKTDHYVILDATTNSIACTLPDPVANFGRLLVIKRIENTAGHTVTLASAGGGVIDGTASHAMGAFEAIHLLAHDVEWYIVGKF